jgi:hypothetical protein
MTRGAGRPRGLRVGEWVGGWVGGRARQRPSARVLMSCAAQTPCCLLPPCLMPDARIVPCDVCMAVAGGSPAGRTPQLASRPALTFVQHSAAVWRASLKQASHAAAWLGGAIRAATASISRMSSWLPTR